MRRKAVRSSTLVSAGYNKTSRVLELEFVSGKVYRYLDVPARVFNELLNAESLGRYMNLHIKNQYTTVYVDSG